MPKELRNAQIDDKELGRVEAIIRSMTPRSGPTPRSSTAPAGPHRRRQRHHRPEVTLLVKQFGEMQKMMKKMATVGVGRKKKKGKKGKKGGGRVAPGGRRAAEAPPALAAFQLPGLN